MSRMTQDRPLQGRTVAVVATDGMEGVEYRDPRATLENAGARVELVAPRHRVQAMEHMDKGEVYRANTLLRDADPADYDALLLPGGVANPDNLRTDPAAIRFVRSFFDAHKPVGAICHAPWTMIDAEVVAGRTLTSYPSLRSDLENAGAEWVDEEVHVEDGLVTSRGPRDLPAFCEAIVDAFAAGPR